jgi:hypothetical protein
MVTCSCCGYTASTGRSSGGGGYLPPDAISRFFRNKGWRIGNVGKKDVCPICAVPARKTVTKEHDMSRDAKVIEIKPALTGVSELPPREMTREDRRIIFAQLEEVYVDEHTGYSTDWNDERVSKHLNCPRKWIETIREENFGPQHAPESPQVIALREKLESTQGAIDVLAADVVPFKKRVADMVAEANGLETRASALLGQLNSLRAELKKITGR